MTRREALLAAAACAPGDRARWQREGEALDEAAIEAICRVRWRRARRIRASMAP